MFAESNSNDKAKKGQRVEPIKRFPHLLIKEDGEIFILS